MLTPRQEKALALLVQDYLDAGEPVSSARLKEMMGGALSGATLRGELMALGDMGYLAQHHASAGRVPTDQGLRFFVDRLAPAAPTPDQQQWLLSLMTHMEDSLEVFLQTLAQGLSEASGLLCLVALHVTETATLEHVDLSYVNPHEALLILGLRGAPTVSTRLKLDQSAPAALIQRVAQRLRECLLDATLSALSEADVEELLNTIALDERRLLRQSLIRTRELLGGGRVRRQMQMRGLGQLMRGLPPADTRELDETLLDEMGQRFGEGPAAVSQVLIGSEMAMAPLGPFASVRTLTEPTPGVRCLTLLLGPRRLPYAQAMALTGLGRQWSERV